MLERYSGATRLYFVVGHPIAQVKAPAGMTRLFDAEGRDAICVPLEVPPESFAQALSLLRTMGNVDGFAVTIPHKFAAARACATLAPRAALLSSVNIIRRNTDGAWHGDMLDGVGMVGAIRAKGGEIAGRRVLLAGAGGAGSAIALALLEAGAHELAVHDADAARRDALLEKLRGPYGDAARAGGADPAGFDIVVNATPAGMAGYDPLPVIADRLGPDTFVADAVTLPEITPLLAQARSRGCPTVTGTEMFQAERQSMFDFWFRGA